MKTSIEVQTRAEGAAIAKGIGDPVARATLVVIGVLADLTDPQRTRVIRNVNESFEDTAS